MGDRHASGQDVTQADEGSRRGAARPGGRKRYRRARALAVLLSVGVLTVAATPLRVRASSFADRLTADAQALWARMTVQPVLSSKAKSFAGTAAVGALFSTGSHGQLGTHFCTASVVNSPAHNLLITAAHCVAGLHGAPIVFVPGYNNGRAPHGVWKITRVVVDQNWASSSDPDDDFAFLVTASIGGRRVQDVTGGEQLGQSIKGANGQVVRVVGYPDGAGAPIWCTNRATSYSPTQWRFDCGGFTDGTSGSPLLEDVNPSTGLGTVVAVIGGYHQGGYTASVSYGARFGPSLHALYETAIHE
jgi:V8-like Glu-specific endopeptidase